MYSVTGPFFICVQACERQRSIVASFRSAARRCDFWELKPRSCKMPPSGRMVRDASAGPEFRQESRRPRTVEKELSQSFPLG